MATGLFKPGSLCTSSHPTKSTITFIRTGDPPATHHPVKTSKETELLIDLEWKLKFPSHIATTTLRPYIVLLESSVSKSSCWSSQIGRVL